jgi:hypothetical protein
MNTAELNSYIGKRGILDMGAIKINIKIIDARSSFGRIDFYISPESGSGAQWVSKERVTVNE